MTLAIELFLSIVAILTLKSLMTYNISIPKFKTIIKPIIYAFVATIVINVLLTLLTKIAGGKIEVPSALSKLKPLQVIIFIFIFASIAEELLFRGVLLNFLTPLRETGIIIFKIRLSLPIIISALAFGAAHLVLIFSGVSFFFILRIIIFTISLGLMAGYYQEKYDNNIYAIIVHATGNILAVIASFSMN